jgi:translation initiation factor 1
MSSAKRPVMPAKYDRLPDDGVVRVFRERRRASSVTVVTGVAQPDLERIGTELKRRCATGGTTKNGMVELQGDHRDAVIAFFEREGRRVKRAGG